jgi:AraC-like DNA-binding protein
LVLEEVLPLDDTGGPVMDAVALVLTKALNLLGTDVYRVSAAAFTFPRPEHADLAEQLFECPVRYGQSWTGVSVPLSVLDRPLILADPAVFADAKLYCERELERKTRDVSTSTQVRGVLLDADGAFPSLQDIASSLHMTARTLHRRLIEEGTSYKAILDEIRRSLAIEQLALDRLSIAEVADALGYQSVANFSRAFKRWQGVTPSEYRESSYATRVKPLP